MKANEVFGSAKWVETPGIGVPCIRGEFAIDKEVKSAEIVICGLGMYSLTLNGKQVGDDLYGTLASDFHDCDVEPCKKLHGEQVGHRIYLRKFDLTELIEEKNCIGVMLGAGWYRCGGIYGFINNYGHNKLCYRITLEYADGTCGEVLSNESLKFTTSNVVGWNFYYGEHHDYHNIKLDGWNIVGFDDRAWQTPPVVAAPDTDYYFSDCPPDRIIRYLEPKLVHETDTDYIYDVGENITGVPILRSDAPSGEKITFRVSERLNPDKTIEDYTNHKQDSSFIVDGSDREYTLKFCWNGFRFCAVSKNARMVNCAVIHSDIKVNSGFKSDSKVLDWLYEAYLRTQLDNMHCGIPSDCPHIEKRGYTGDGELVCECGMLLLDSQSFYRKWLYDISDCQDRISGHVQYTAPYIHSGGGPGGWGCAIAEVPYYYYKTYGDKSVLDEFLLQSLHYFNYLEAHSENNLVMTDQPGEWCLGDWCTPEKLVIPVPFVNTYFYVKTIDRLLEFCNILGRRELIPILKERRRIKCAAIVENYFDTRTGDFAENVQGANAFAVDIGLGDERTLANIVSHYEAECWYDTGIFGTDIVTRVLFEKGYDDLAFRLLTSEGKYSFHRWMEDDCTTFPEYWTYQRSQNHPMFGAVTRYLFTYLLGIGQKGAGYSYLVIKPRFVDGMNRASGYITTVSGKIAVAYEKVDGKISITVEIPEGVKAVLIAYGEHELHAGVNELTV